MTEVRTARGRLPTDRPIPPANFAHVVIRTADIDATLAWYQAVLGARTVFRNAMICFVTYDREHHRLAFLRVPDGPAPPGGGAVDHIAYGYNDLGELLATYYRLRQQGILPVRTINHGPTISFYYRDPNGVRIELQIDNFATAEEADAFFNGAEFAANPIGVLIDPDRLRADWEAGLPWTEIRRRPPLPPGATVADMRAERA